MNSKVDMLCIIDDDPIFIFATRKILEKEGFTNTFLIYSNGQDALENLTQLNNAGEELPDLILLDLNMPVMDGWRFLDTFTMLPTSKKIVIYIVSSSIDPKDLAKTKKYEAISNYIVKPISTHKIREIIKDF